MELWHIPVIILSIPAAFALTVIIHEYGHWIGGIFTGYKTVYICLFTLVFYKDAKGKNRNARYPGMIGQCIMAPRKNKEPKPDDLILGGPALSLVTGAAVAGYMFAKLKLVLDQADGLTGTQVVVFAIVGIFATMNLTFGITNLIPRGTNDGANFREVRKSDANRKAYNKVMKVYSGNVRGTMLCEMPDDLLSIPEGAEGSLAEELAEYSRIKKESSEYMKNGSPEQKGKYETGNPDMKTGSWEIWEMCRKDSPERSEEYLGICRKHMDRCELGLGEWKMAEELIIRRMETNNGKKEG